MNASEKKAAKIITRGILGAWGWLGASALAVAFLATPTLEYLRDRDSTDGAARSNMTPHTDALTGCQYLSVPGSGLTPRLDASGKPMCGVTPPTASIEHGPVQAVTAEQKTDIIPRQLLDQPRFLI